MSIIKNKNKIYITELLDMAVWKQATSDLDGDDFSIYVSQADIRIDLLNIPESIAFLSIDESNFYGSVEINGLVRLGAISISNCIQKNFGLIKIKNCELNGFYFKEKKYKFKNHKLVNLLSLDFVSCVIRNFESNSCEMHCFTKVLFDDKFRLNAHTISNNNSLIFKECIFMDYMNIMIQNHHDMTISIQDSSNKNSETVDASYISLNTKNVTFKKLAIENSDLHSTSINLFKIEIKIIEILNSTIKELDIHTVDDADAPKRIYNLSIENSFIKSLLLNNRRIVHPIKFTNTTFYAPPQLHGTSIAHGSSFPSREYYLRTNGEQDAASYRTLRSFMESQRNRELEGIFFVLEQESLLNSKTSIFKYLSLRFIYKIISNYGTSYIRPIFILLILTMFFAILYAIIASPVIDPTLSFDNKLIINSVIYSLKQTLQPYFILKDVSLDKVTENPITILISILNSTLSLTCVALSALAINWKFKRG